MNKAIMFQGTSSNVGKSVLAAGVCRLLLEDGVRVAPFKAQNMALNSYVTLEGLEMGRAQATQAAACRLEPHVRMNPILLKPSAGVGSQLIVLGRPDGGITFENYKESKEKLRRVVRESYDYMSSRYDVLVIEGAGSPAEVNLKKNDITNMHVAKLAQAPVVIVGDIDRGGVYAHFVGTYELLDPDEQALTAGFIINKFRGVASLLQPANEFLERRTGKPIFGVVPMVNDLALPDEDSVAFKGRIGRVKGREAGVVDEGKIRIALIDLPHISNFTDFDPFEMEPDVSLEVVNRADDIMGADIVILPGSKNTIHDMNYLNAKNFPAAIKKYVSGGGMLLGICGGYQMLGRRIEDPGTVESVQAGIEGLGFLDMETRMAPEKTLTRVSGTCVLDGVNIPVSGYEIHHGFSPSKENPFIKGEDGVVLGGCSASGNVWGTYLHGIFDRWELRKHLLDGFRRRKGLPVPIEGISYDIDGELTRLAGILRESIDVGALYRLIGL